MIKDSGQKREFDTGSHRDIASGKGRCDLLPEYSVLCVMDVKSDVKDLSIKNNMWQAVADVMNFKRNTKDMLPLIKAAREALVCVGIDEGAALQGVDVHDEDACVAIGLMKTAIHYEEGADKYGANNWKKGQPVHVLIDSGLRHAFKGIAGNNDEPHLRAAAWNFLCAVWTIHNLPEMMDLPENGDLRP